ncbi:MAG: hypothetical protein WC144_05600 [Sulfurimonas sp.]|jgi:hypothetical protein|nr:hypothetical protein [Sulfurimonadaceae bacterium]
MPEILSILVLDAIFVFFTIIAFYISAKIYLFWDIDSTKPLQYSLEKSGFLASTIIKFILSIKIPLFLFFVFTLDKISNVLSGAMCGAGVLDATPYGLYLMVFKVVNIYLFALWLKLNSADMLNETQPYTKLKSLAFLALGVLLFTEIAIEIAMFSSIEVDKIVSCCGSIYSSSSSSLISDLFLIDNKIVVAIFYSLFGLIVLFYFLKNSLLFALSNLLFIVVSLIAIILFFSTYVYELPTHHCPFCLLQKEYYFVGYFIYSFGFLGTFYGLSAAIFKKDEANFRLSLVFNSLYVILLSSYVVLYYLKNGVFL